MIEVGKEWIGEQAVSIFALGAVETSTSDCGDMVPQR